MPEVKIELRSFGTNANTTDDVVGVLDVNSNEDFPLSLTMSNFDSRDLKSRSGSFSKTFDIPATKNNNMVLKNLWKSGYIQSTKNVLGNIPSVIYVDNVPIISGKMRVTKVSLDTNVKSYSCSFIGDNADWASSIKNKEMKELRFSATSYDTYASQDPSIDTLENGGIASVPHNFNYDKVIEGSGRFVGNDFPVSDGAGGQTASDAESSTVGDIAVDNRDKIFYPPISIGENISSQRMLTTLDYIPCLFVKNIWDKIFQSEGYKVESEFCNSEFFRRLVVPLNFERTGEMIDDKFGRIESTTYNELQSIWYNGGQAAHTNGEAVANIPLVRRTGYTHSSSGYTTLARFVFNGTDIEDESTSDTGVSDGNVRRGASGLGDGTTVVTQGQGSQLVTAGINIRHYHDAGSFSGNFGYTLRVELWKIPNNAGVPLDDDAGIYEAVDNGYDHNGFVRVDWQDADFNATGDYDQVKAFNLSHLDEDSVENHYVVCAMAYVTNYPYWNGGSVTFGFEEGSYLQVEGEVEYDVGDDIDDIHFLLPKGKQSDFVAGITQMFNLQYHTDPIQKKVYVEPFDYFFDKREDAIDLTDKVDYSKGISDEFIDEIKSTIIFKYKDASSDALLEKYNKKNFIDWGAYKEINTDGVFQDGEYIVENKFFSPTFNWIETQNLNSSAANVRAATVPMYHTDYTEVNANYQLERPEKDFNIGARILVSLPTHSSNGNNLATYQHHQSTGSTTKTSLSQISKLRDDNVASGEGVYHAFQRANFIHFDTRLKVWDNATDSFTTEGDTKLSIGTYYGTEVKIDPNLSFNKVKHTHKLYTSVGGVQQGYKEKNGLYINFHARMMNQLKNNPKIRTVYVNLSYVDLLRFDFRKLVYLDGLYYRVNKIVDFKPHRNESTKMELVEHFDLGLGSIDGDIMDLHANGLNI
jgi:ribosomal protein S8